MKKTKLLLLFTLTICAAQAQFKYKGVGIFGSLTQSAHHYNNLDTDKKDTTFNINHYYPETHYSKEFFNWGAGAFVEFGNQDLRWQTELEYINKGAKEMALTNPFTGERSGSFSSTKLTYIEWNNYLKFYYPLGYAHCYWMPGIRLEYLFKKSAGAYSDVVNSFPTFWFSGDIAVGYEFPLFKKFSAFAEYHWNPDIIPYTYNSNTKIRKRTFELRLGVMMRPRKRSIDDCTAPTYKGPAY